MLIFIHQACSTFSHSRRTEAFLHMRWCDHFKDKSVNRYNSQVIQKIYLTYINVYLLTLAAHCVLDKGQRFARLPREIVIMLGQYDLDATFEVGRIVVSPKKIVIHPDWNSRLKAFDADLAVIELEDEIQFNEYIQPICLWEDFQNPIASSGIIIGYGKSENFSKRHENIPKVLDVPIHYNEDCFLHEPNLAKLSSKRTFCGGSADGTGACVGDSGSPLMIDVDGVYYLRGIVSSSLRDPMKNCDVTKYGVYTNALKFKNWLKNYDTSEDSIDNSCGVMDSTDLSGSPFTTREQFPWMASIYYKDKGLWTSGVLVSSKHVLSNIGTVAYIGESVTHFIPDGLYRYKIYLGTVRHNDASMQGAYIAKPTSIVVNPAARYVYGQVSVEVAKFVVITLEQPVTFNQYIKPVCLWPYGSDLNLIADAPLYTAGYRRNRAGNHLPDKKHARVKLNKQSVCNTKLPYLPLLFKSVKTICLTGNGVDGPCEGDVPLFVKYQEKWFLRGFQLKVYENANDTCYDSLPVVYEDITTKVKWIRSKIEV
jgi:Trypsin